MVSTVPDIIISRPPLNSLLLLMHFGPNVPHIRPQANDEICYRFDLVLSTPLKSFWDYSPRLGQGRPLLLTFISFCMGPYKSQKITRCETQDTEVLFRLCR